MKPQHNRQRYSGIITCESHYSPKTSQLVNLSTDPHTTESYNQKIRQDLAPKFHSHPQIRLKVVLGEIFPSCATSQSGSPGNNIQKQTTDKATGAHTEIIKILSSDWIRKCHLKISLQLPEGGLQTDWPSSQKRINPGWLSESPEELSSHKGVNWRVASPDGVARTPSFSTPVAKTSLAELQYHNAGHHTKATSPRVQQCTLAKQNVTPFAVSGS